MPKMKTNSSAKKRFALTATGKIKRKSAFKRHILTKKSNDQKRRLGHTTIVSKADEGQVKRMLCIGK
jgi:large subunit ribosomal protein L35